MKYPIFWACVAITAATTAASFYYFYLTRPNDHASVRASPAPHSISVAAVAAQAASADEALELPTSKAGTVSGGSDSTTADFDAMIERNVVSYDPMILTALGDFTDDEIDAYNALHIQPFNRAIGQVCTEIPVEGAPDTFGRQCQTLRERPPHPFEELSSDDLQELAVDNAVEIGRAHV